VRGAPNTGHSRRRNAVVLVAAVALFAVGYVGSHRGILDGVGVATVWVPTSSGVLHGRLYRPRTGGLNSAPGVVVFHGYLGNLVTMEVPLSAELARRGFVVLAVDYLGHGRSGGGTRTTEFIGDENTPSPRRAMLDVVRFLRAQPGVDPARIALVGHSAGAKAAGFVASVDPTVVATVYIAGVFDAYLFEPTAAPRNLLMLYGGADGWIPGRWPDSARDVEWVQHPGTMVGSFSAGSARKYTVLPGLDHVQMVLAPSARAEVIRWLASATGVSVPEPITVRPIPYRWLALGYLGIAIGLFALLAWLEPWLVGITPPAEPARDGMRDWLGRAWRLLVFAAGVASAGTLIPWWNDRLGWVPVSGGVWMVGPLWAIASALLVACVPVIAGPGGLRSVVAPLRPGIRTSLGGAAVGVLCWVYLVVTQMVLTLHYFDTVPTWRRVRLMAAVAAAVAVPFTIWCAWTMEVVWGAHGHRRAAAATTLVAVLVGLCAFVRGALPQFHAINLIFLFLLTLLLAMPLLFVTVVARRDSWAPAAAFGTLLIAWVFGLVCPFQLADARDPSMLPAPPALTVRTVHGDGSAARSSSVTP